jgi:hypothetical protein
MLKKFEFPTEAEARAFAEGVEFVNDSSVEVVSTAQESVSGSWTVTVEDNS